MTGTQESPTATCVVLAVLLLGAGGCYNSFIELGDGDHGADGPTEAAGEAEADTTDADVETDGVADVPAETDGVSCPGWYDSASGLCWQDPPEESLRSWDDAIAYCNGLSLGGTDDWHLPTISELRSFIRGCPWTETGGACGVTDACLGWECRDEVACHGCSDTDDGRGPGSGGAYWPLDVRGTPYWYWSSSPTPGGYDAWLVYFPRGYVEEFEKELTFRVRCVRPGP